MTGVGNTTTARPLLHWGLALGLGVLAAALNQWTVPILTSDTPSFLLGGIPVFVSFVALGAVPGLLTVLISLTVLPLETLASAHPAAAAGLLIYVVEGLMVGLLYRRTRSVPLAAVLFWFGGGWILTVLNYQVWMGLTAGYTALFIVKQVLNALINALGAELVLSRPVQEWLAGIRGGEAAPVSLDHFAFRRTVLLTLIPLTLLGLLWARAQYEDVIDEITEQNTRVAWDAVREVDLYLEERHGTLGRLARALELSDDEVNVGVHLEAFLTMFPEVYLAALADSTGRVTAIRPETSQAGDPLAGLDVSEREYFRRVMDGSSTVYGELLLGELEIRSEDEVEPAVVMAQPLVYDDGSFRGALLASLDPAEVTARFRTACPEPVEGRSRPRVTLFDRAGSLIASTVDARTSGTPIDQLVRGPNGSELDPFPLADRNQPANFTYFPTSSGSMESALGLNLTFATFQPVLRSGWGVMSEMPSEVLYARMMPVAGQILALVGVGLLLLVMVVRAFSHTVARPLEAAAQTARRITAGELERNVVAPELGRSPLREPRELHASLEQMRATLAAREEASRARQQDLEAQLLQAQKMEAVGLLAGGIAHDFNNMLTPIVGLADLGRGDAGSDLVRDHFKEIGSAAARAREVVQQLLAFSRKQVLARVPLDLAWELRRAEPLLRSLLREDVELLIAEGDEQQPVLADRAQLQQILVNLAVNAQDAMPSGGRLKLSLERVPRGSAELAEEGLEGRPLVRLHVTDSGEGIPAENLSQVFDPFFSTKFPGEGTGLGLATVYGIVRQHEGAIRVRSTPGDGASFLIYLPLTRRPLEPSDDDAPGRANGELAQGGERILLVEDDDAVRRFVRRTLERSGYEVTATSTAEEALAAVDTRVAFDMLLTDVILPGRNGRQLYEELRRRRPDLPALFISGYSHDVLGDAGPPDGARFLAKPFELEELMDRVRAVLDDAPGVRS